MTPESSFDMNDMEFERELKGLGKKEFFEFRKKFREYTSIVTKEKGQSSNPSSHSSLSFTKQLRNISSKLHLLKKEFEKREVNERIYDRISNMLRNPEAMLQIDDLGFKEAIHKMESKEFEQYLVHFKNIFQSILNNRREIIQLNATISTFDKQQRDNLKIIKRGDLLEEEMLDREKRVLKAG